MHGRDDTGSPFFIGNAEQHTERFAQCLAMLCTHQVLTSIPIAGIVTVFFHPEPVVDGLLQGFRLLGILLGILLVAQCGSHVGSHLQHTIEGSIRAQTFGQIDVRRLCPCGITLFAPVDERAFASIETGLRIIDHHIVTFQTLHDDRICFLQPLHITGSQIDVPSRKCPHHSIRRAWP